MSKTKKIVLHKNTVRTLGVRSHIRTGASTVTQDSEFCTFATCPSAKCDGGAPKPPPVR